MLIPTSCNAYQSIGSGFSFFLRSRSRATSPIFISYESLRRMENYHGSVAEAFREGSRGRDGATITGYLIVLALSMRG